MKDNLEKIKSGLSARYGAVAEVARRAGRSTVQVQRVLNGTNENPSLLKIAAEVLAERIKEEIEAKAAINDTLDILADYEQC